MASGGAVGRLRFGLNVDRTADPLTWAMTDATARTQTGGAIAVRRGRSGGAQEAQPGSSQVVLDNGDGALTPLYPASTYYPDLDLGVPVEVAVKAGLTSLLTASATGGAETPDTAVLDITGDIAVAIEVESPLRFGGYGLDFPVMNLANKWRTAGDNRSWLMTVSTTGCLMFLWTTSGAIGTQTGFTSTYRLPRYDAGPAVYGVWLDVNNGAGGRTITFYAGRGTIADLIADPTRFVFDTQTLSGTTSIFASTAPVDIGINPDNTDIPYVGRIRGLVVVEGSFAGTQRARPDFSAQTAGTTSFVDAPGRTWTLGASSSIDAYHTRLLGELVASSPAWPGNGVEQGAQVSWEIAGVLRRMRQRDEPLESTLFRFITAPIHGTAVKAYWPMEDGSAAMSASSPIEGVAPMKIGAPGNAMRFAADATLASSKALMHSDSVIYFAGDVPTYSATQHRIDMFARIDTPGGIGAGSSIFAVSTTGTVRQWNFAIDNTNVYLQGFDAFGASIFSNTSASDARMFGTWCLFSLNIEQNGGNVDWAWSIVPIPLGVAFGNNNSVAGTVGTVIAVHNWGTAAPATGGQSMGHIIVTTGKGLGWLARADSAFAGEPAASRFDRLCREQGVPVLVDGWYGNNWDQIKAKGGKPMGPQRPIKFLDLLAECAVVERAVTGEARELLGLTYRSTLYNQSPAITFTNELGNPFTPTRDDQGVVNDLTVARNDAETFRQIDQPSIDKAGPYPHQQPTNTETELGLSDVASAILAEALVPEMRIPSLQIELGKDTSLFEDWLGVRFGDLIQSDAVPPFYPGPEVRQIMAGYLEEISAPHWRLTMNGTPATMLDVGVRDDTDLGLRDTSGSVINADFDAGTDTTLEVATTLGPLWADTAASNSGLPFDLNVGGYRVPCTAIGGQGPIAFGSTGTVAHANNADITPALPASTAEGDLLIAWTAIRNTSGSVSGATNGWELITAFGNVTLFGKIAGPSETNPTFSIFGGVANADVSGQIVRFTGPFHSITRSIVAQSVVSVNASAQDIAYNGVAIGEPNCLVLYLGWKQDDWTSVATISGATEIGEPDTTTGDDQGIVWDYLIQTTAADIPAGSFVVTGGASAISKGLVVVIRSSVQIFTVSATVWPAIPKTIPAGSPVSLWRPARRGLTATRSTP